MIALTNCHVAICQSMWPPVATCPVLNTFSLITAHGARLAAFREQSLLSLEMELSTQRTCTGNPLSRVLTDKTQGTRPEAAYQLSARDGTHVCPLFWVGTTRGFR